MHTSKEKKKEKKGRKKSQHQQLSRRSIGHFVISLEWAQHCNKTCCFFLQSNKCSILDFSDGIITFLFHIVSCTNNSACKNTSWHDPPASTTLCGEFAANTSVWTSMLLFSLSAFQCCVINVFFRSITHSYTQRLQISIPHLCTLDPTKSNFQNFVLFPEK